MKLTTGINHIAGKNVEKTLSKKILLANTIEKSVDKKITKNSVGSPSDPIYFTNNDSILFNPDIRYRNNFAYSPLTGINYRNDLLVFSENNEIKKAVDIIANETVILDTEMHKYSVFPKINITQIDPKKQKIAEAIQDYLDKVFYPMLWHLYDFKDEGLLELIKEFVKTGKLAFEIIYDNLKNPKDIIGIVPIDPATLQKFKNGEYIYFVQRPLMDNAKERIMHENQVILIEWNRFDFGFISYVDKLRRNFNVMRSMQTSKILWFAAKSQVRMHIKLAMGDVGRFEAIQKLTEAKNQYINKYTFDDDGVVRFNNQPNNSGYREFFTAETQSSGEPAIEEINSNGPDLTEVDSLQYWEKYYWKDTDIPYDRIDPNSSDSWGFTDVNSLRKIEVNFSKVINGIRKLINPIFLKPIIIQLTLKEVEIGVDLSLLDAIKMEWIAYNQYEKLAELEVLAKKIEIAQNISSFGEQEDSEGRMRKAIPIGWIIKNHLDYTNEQLESMDIERKRDDFKLGFIANDGEPIEENSDDKDAEKFTKETSDEFSEETSEELMKFDDEKY